jgi:hypothetical protein
MINMAKKMYFSRKKKGSQSTKKKQIVSRYVPSGDDPLAAWRVPVDFVPSDTAVLDLDALYPREEAHDLGLSSGTLCAEQPWFPSFDAPFSPAHDYVMVEDVLLLS